MSEKKYTPREAALAVLTKTQEILARSELAKSEKYKTEMKKEPSKAPKDNSKKLERDYEDFEVKSGKSKSSDDKRGAKQVSPSKNPKEEAENNNPPPGAEPKNLGGADLEKGEENPDKEADAKLGEKVEKDVEDHFEHNKEAEKKEGHKLMVKCDKCGNMHKSEDFEDLCESLNSLKENFEEMNKAEKHQKLANKVLHNKEGLKEALHEANHPKKVLHDLREDKKVEKAESKHDRCVEHVKENSPDVKNPHAVCVAEVVKPAKWSKEEGQPSIFVPAKLVGSAKLSKFMERIHAKRKARNAQDTPDEHAGEEHVHSVERAIDETSSPHGHESNPHEDWQGRVK